MNLRTLMAVSISISLFITAGCQSGSDSTEKLHQENQSLQAQVSNLEAEIDSLKQQVEAAAVSFKPKTGWEQYFPQPEQTTLKGYTVDAVRELLGNPPIMIRSLSADSQYNREIWIYHVQDEDQTALFLWFRGDKLWRSKLDEFNGLMNAGSFFDYEDFWN